MPSYPLKILDASTSFTTVRFSDRSKFGVARIWLPDASVFDPVKLEGWNLVVRLHGGNGNNQGDLDPESSQFLLMLLNQLGCVVVSINWQDNGFYVPGGQDPRALFFPDGLLEPAMIVTWLVQRSEDASLFGPGGGITSDPDRIALFGLSDGAWRAALLTYLRRNELGLEPAVEKLLGTEFVQPNVLIASSGHFDIEHFWMSEPIDSLSGWSTTTEKLAGATTLDLGGGKGEWHVGHQLELALPNQKGFEYLVTAIAGDTLTVWPPLRVPAAAGTQVFPFDTGLSKYAQGGYSWLGAPLFRAGGNITWASFPPERKRDAGLWPRITRENARVNAVRAVLLYPPAEPLVTNDGDPVSGWRAFLSSPAPNPRYQNLHAEANAYALAGLLSELDLTQGTDPDDDFLLRAGGQRSNPDPATRFNNTAGEVTAALKLFLQNHGW